MLDIFTGNSKAYKQAIHDALNIVFEYFIEVGSNLEYDEIYGDVFPLHMQDEDDRENKGITFLKQLHREIIDNFSHEFSPLKEYVLYHILLYVHEGSEGEFLLSDTIQKSISKKRNGSLTEDELIVLNTIETPLDLIGICFEDLDFLDIGELFDIYKIAPEFVRDFLHVDIECYKDLLPNDILSEYNAIQAKSDTQSTSLEKNISKNEIFYKTLDLSIDHFKSFIEHKKGYMLLNYADVLAKEKQVQVLFNEILRTSLNNYGILISSELDTGRGSVDFQVSKGTELQALIEIKLGSHQRYKDGLTYQLPVYLLTEQVNLGYFILICYTQEIYEESQALYQIAEELSAKYNKKIHFERIDASGTLKSASKIHLEQDMGFN